MTKIYYTWRKQNKLNKCKRIKIIQNLLSGYSEIKFEINNIKASEKSLYI